MLTQTGSFSYLPISSNYSCKWLMMHKMKQEKKKAVPCWRGWSIYYGGETRNKRRPKNHQLSKRNCVSNQKLATYHISPAIKIHVIWHFVVIELFVWGRKMSEQNDIKQQSLVVKWRFETVYHTTTVQTVNRDSSSWLCKYWIYY